MTFRFDWRLALVVALVAGTCVRLGFWQLHRADERRERDAAIEERLRDAPLDVGPGTRVSAESRFRRAVLKGHYEAAGQVYLDNQMSNGQPGVRVITPLRIEGSTVRVAVDRGWVAFGPGRTVPPAAVPDGPVEVHGILDAPSRPKFLPGAAGEPGPAWGKLWPWLALDNFPSTAGYPVEPYVVRLDPADAHGFVRVLPIPERKAPMNTGYAIQWFSFAFLAICVFVGLSLRRTGRRGVEEEKR